MSKSLSSFISNFLLLQKSANKASQHSISRGKKAEWEEIAHASEALLPEIQKIYWSGVERELRDVILTLKTWRQPAFANIMLEDEKDDEIYGFDTFIDQVNETSRELAVMYAREKAATLERTKGGEFVPHSSVLQDIARKFVANSQSKTLKEEIKQYLEELPREEDHVRRRARMLLQSAGWLDIDKLIEHRPPLDGVSFWKRPMPPQLKLQRFYSDSTPHFVPQRCMLCAQVIRGSLFQCQSCKEVEKGYICEDCQHEGQHRGHNLTKVYKHCILAETIDPTMSRKMCKCGSIMRINSDGSPRTLFPVDGADSHRASVGGAVQCNILALKDLVAEAKYDAIRLKMNERTLDQERQLHEASKRAKAEKAAKDKTYKLISTETINEKEADANIPFFIRGITDRYPFGNVHMALRLGPVLIENGVEHTQGGALITSRDPPSWQEAPSSDKDNAYSLAVSADRTLYWQNRVERHTKRYKTALKQVIGGLFSGLCQTTLENEVVELIMDASTRDLDNPGDPIKVREHLWKETLDPILEKLRLLMNDRVQKMLSSVAQKLSNRTITIQWDKTTNNCQDFCFNLLDYNLYGSFLPSHTPDEEPLYLLSFVCRPGSYKHERKVQSKFEIPSGLCEEYLLKFRYGLHIDSDIVDTLQEYWYDWGAFGGSLYRYQDLFPWDCTEAYGRSATKCSDCNISKHVWSFPFDSWSISSLHLTRPRLLYPDVSSKQSWMRNRLQVLLAQDVLHKAARAMASSPEFQRSTAWLTGHKDERMDRLKLGGIHRAQPFSHQYEEGRYHEYFVAPWAHLRRGNQIEEYERIREERRALPDVPIYMSSYEHHDTDDGNGGADDNINVGLCFGAYFSDGWDGAYSQAETMSAADAALVGTTDHSADSYEGDSAGCGGCGGGGCGEE